MCEMKESKIGLYLFYSFIAGNVYTCEEVVLVTEAPQRNRTTAKRQDTDDKKNNK